MYDCGWFIMVFQVDSAVLVVTCPIKLCPICSVNFSKVMGGRNFS